MIAPHAGPGDMAAPAGLLERIDRYFATVTDEQLAEVLRRADFDHYNKIGAPILEPPEAQSGPY